MPKAVESAAIEMLTNECGEELAFDLLTLYLAESPEKLELIKKAVASEDAHALERSAHNLKSSSAVLGVAKVAEDCGKLEKLGEEKKTDASQELLFLLEEHYIEATGLLRQALKESSPVLFLKSLK